MKPSEIVSWILNILLISAVILLVIKLQIPTYKPEVPIFVDESVYKEVIKTVKEKVPAIHDTTFVDGNPAVFAYSDTTYKDKEGNKIAVQYFYPPYDFFNIDAKIAVKEKETVKWRERTVEVQVPYKESISGWARIRPSIQLGGGAIYTDKQLKLGWYLGAGVSYIIW